jgi:hypothetical protein
MFARIYGLGGFFVCDVWTEVDMVVLQTIEATGMVPTIVSMLRAGPSENLQAHLLYVLTNALSTCKFLFFFLCALHVPSVPTSFAAHAQTCVCACADVCAKMRDLVSWNVFGQRFDGVG